MDRLEQMLNRQVEVQLQMKPVGRDPRDLDGEDLVMFLKDMALATLDEVHEMLGEIGWKPWATSRHVNVQPAKKEMIDEWHFWMNLWLALGGTTKEMLEMYMAKSQTNIDRQLEGYDGVSTKCPSCHREL